MASCGLGIYAAGWLQKMLVSSSSDQISLQISLQAQDMAVLLAIGGAVVLIAVFLAVFPILKTSPVKYFQEWRDRAVNVLQRAWRSVIRKPVRSILLLLVVCIISLLFLSGMASRSANIAAKDQYPAGNRRRLLANEERRK